MAPAMGSAEARSWLLACPSGAQWRWRRHRQKIGSGFRAEKRTSDFPDRPTGHLAPDPLRIKRPSAERALQREGFVVRIRRRSGPQSAEPDGKMPRRSAMVRAIRRSPLRVDALAAIAQPPAVLLCHL